MKTKWLEANQTIIRNDREITITITALLHNQNIQNIIAFDNDGNERYLTPTEQEKAEEILLEGLNP